MAPFLLFLLFFISAQAAHLPAIRRPFRHQDEKRELASKLIRSANRNKEQSLQDVLGETDAPTLSSSGRRDTQRKRMRAEQAARDRLNEEPADTNRLTEEDVVEEAEEEGIHTMSQLFAWAINNTVTGAAFSYSTKIPKDAQRLSQTQSNTQRKALPSGDQRLRTERTSRRRQKTSSDSAHASREDFELLNSAAENEFDIIRRNVHVIQTKAQSPKETSRALLMLEELCHSIDNGRDLQISGGIRPVLNALESNHEVVRASAAWAIATCCQNNPPVQNASLNLGAVPLLSRLAAQDESTMVRARALFALNALLELEEARGKFEELPNAIDVLRNALLDRSDKRMTRRALNLTELLVGKNLDMWKTQLEAYDVPNLVEIIMRSHPDTDVRESAARTIAALDGKHVA